MSFLSGSEAEPIRCGTAEKQHLPAASLAVLLQNHPAGALEPALKACSPTEGTSCKRNRADAFPLRVTPALRRQAAASTQEQIQMLHAHHYCRLCEEREQQAGDVLKTRARSSLLNLLLHLQRGKCRFTDPTNTPTNGVKIHGLLTHLPHFKQCKNPNYVLHIHAGQPESKEKYLPTSYPTFVLPPLLGMLHGDMQECTQGGGQLTRQ